MQIVLELYELKNICTKCAELGAANYAKSTTPAKDLMSQREAYRVFGEARVKRWVHDGLYLAPGWAPPSAQRSNTPERN